MLLLVSVIGEEEVPAAVAGGADIIDVKNPREGSLGAPLPSVIREVRRAASGDVPVSAAIGDVPDLPGTVALAAVAAAACGAAYVKVGLWGPDTAQKAGKLLEGCVREVREAAPQAAVIAVGYGDADVAGGLSPVELPRVAAQAGAAGAMLDTARKDGASLFSSLSPEQAEAFVRECGARGLLSALAGSLGLDDLDLLHALSPDIIGVRGAVCGGDRLAGRVEQTAVRRFKDRLMAT